jgi:hypothetical protein
MGSLTIYFSMRRLTSNIDIFPYGKGLGSKPPSSNLISRKNGKVDGPLRVEGGVKAGKNYNQKQIATKNEKMHRPFHPRGRGVGMEG